MGVHRKRETGFSDSGTRRENSIQQKETSDTIGTAGWSSHWATACNRNRAAHLFKRVQNYDGLMAVAQPRRSWWPVNPTMNWNFIPSEVSFAELLSANAAKIGIDNVYYFGRLNRQNGDAAMTFISRSADDRLQLHSAARRNRRLQDIVLTLAFFLSVGFAAAVVFGII